jgi:hypothetical protein
MNKKHLIGYPVAVILAMTIGAAGASGSSTATVAAQSVPTVTATVAGPVVTETVTAPAPEPVAAEPAAPAATGSSCDNAREAILTGTTAGITKTFKALVADKTADATAREYARYYLGRDKDSKQFREMDVSLIQMSCS